MNEVRRPLRRDGPALPTPTRLLYLTGASAERDASTLQQLSALTGQVQLTTVGTAADVQQKIRSGGYHALVISHVWPQADTLSLISALRKANAPIAIVPVVTETQRDLYASAVAVGADDVLILLGGTLLHPTETLVRVRQSRYLPAHEVEAVRAAIRGQHAAPSAGAVPPAGAAQPAARPLEESKASEDGLTAFASETPDAPPAPASAAVSPGSPRPVPPPPLHGGVGPAQPRAPQRAASSPAATTSDRDAVRRDLERRLTQAEADAASRREAHAALVASRQELECAVQAHGAAREAWAREREELLSEARSAAAATTVVESRLHAALADVDRLSKLHAAAEETWQETRREWETARERARTDLETALADERDGRRAAEMAHATDRARWEETRQVLERQLEAATALAASRADLEGALGGAEAVLRQATEAHAAERLTWEAARRSLGQRAAEAEAAVEARRAAEAALEDARAALRSADQARTTERQDWTRERAQLEARLHETSEAIGARGGLEADLRLREAELAEATAALDRERAAAKELHERLASQHAELDVLARARDQLEQALDAARADLRQMTDARAAERADVTRLRDQLDGALGDVRALGQMRANEQAEAARMRDRVEALRAELDSAVRARGESDEQLQVARVDLQEAAEALTATRAAADAARQALEVRLADTESMARAERADLERRIAALGTDLRRSIEAGAADRLALDVATEQLRAQRAEMATLDAARSEADAALGRARADHEGAQAREAAARQDAEAAHETIATLRSELAAVASARARAIQEMAEVRADRDRLAALHEQSLADAHRTAEALREEAGRTAQTIRDLEAALADVRSDRQRLADEQAADRTARDADRHTFERQREDARRRLDELERARDTALQELDRTVRDHAGVAAGWDERRRALEADLAAVHEARAAERMDWMTARLALETRLSQADDELDRQRDETGTLRAELGRVAARYDRLAQSELFGYGVTTLDGWLVHCNDTFARLLGYSTAREALASASEHAFGADGSDVISGATLVEGQIRYRDGLLTRIDGQSVRVLQSALLLGGGQDALVERVVLDLSDRTALEDRLREAQRLEALGRLTAAMAPEFESLAAVLDTGLSVPLDSLDDGADVMPPAGVAELRQLLAFTRKQARPAGLLDLNDALERLSPMLARLVSSHVEFAMRLGPTALVAVDEEDFEQMTTALVVAVRDCLTAGGSLLIETGTLEIADTDRRPAVGRGGGAGAVLTVTAAGYGAQQAEPSATLDAVVERLGGTLRLSGRAGRRVTLRVDLPRIG